MPVNFFNLVHQTLTQQRTKELIIWPGKNGTTKKYTGNDLLEKVAAIQVALLNHPITSAQNVLLAIPVSVDLICAMFAVQTIGAVPVLPAANASSRNLLRVINNQRIKVVLMVTPPTLLMRLVGLVKISTFINVHNLINSPAPVQIINVSAEQPALISYSSGSTGKAKAIYRSHQVLITQHNLLKNEFPPWPGQIDFPLFPNILLHNLAAGIISVLPDIHGFKLSELKPAKIIDQLINQHIQTLTGNVFYFKRILHHLQRNPVTFNDVHAIGIGGSPVPEAIAIALKKYFINADVYIIYGSSEAEPIAIRKVMKEKNDPITGYNVGKINANLQLQIAPVGEIICGSKMYAVGEITVKGSHVAINKDEEYLHSGDFGYLDEHNNLHLTARKGNEKICAGYQHYQVEHLLANDERIENVAAIIKNDGFAIFVQGNISTKEILDILNKHLPANIIKSINKRNNIPVDARHLSKILYNKVR